jgi:HEAT repeat protein
MVLSGALEDPSERDRVAAAESLVRFRRGLPRVLPDFNRSFEKARPEARRAYTIVLERIRPRAFLATEAVPALVSALASPDDEIRCLTATALAAFGEDARPAIPTLVATICRPVRDPRPGAVDRRDPALAAARAILNILPENALRLKPSVSIDSDSLSALAKVLHSGDPQVRAAVALALGRFRPNPAVIPVLGDAVRDPDAAVRAAALKALHDIGDSMPFVPPGTVGAALADQSPQVRYWAAGALGHAGLGIDAFVPELVRRAEHDPDAEVRAVCAFELQEFLRPPAVTPRVVPVLIEALDCPDERVRRAACGLLARFGPASASAVPALIRLARLNADGRGVARDDSSGIDPQAAATALGAIAPRTLHADNAATVLMEMLQAETASTRPEAIAVIQALARFGPHAHGAIPRLRELEEGSNSGVRQSAREALLIIEDPE